MDTIYLYIGVILSTLSLNPHEFALGLYPKGITCPSLYTHDQRICNFLKYFLFKNILKKI